MATAQAENTLESLLANKTGVATISSPKPGCKKIMVEWDGGQWMAEIGCQYRSIQRWLLYGNAVADYYGIDDENLAWLRGQILSIAKTLGVPIPDDPGNAAFDYATDEMEDEDDDEDWEDDWEDDDDDLDDDEDDDWEDFGDE